jgi:RNA polymerase sigma factor (sigma-70 family)
MQKLNDNQVLQGLKHQDKAAYQLLYQCYYPVVEKYVLRNNGSQADARDLFQDALLVLCRQTAADDFTLTCSLKTYLFAISQNLWLKQLRKVKRGLRIELESLQRAENGSFSLGWECQLEAEKTLVQKINLWLSRITIHCQTLLKNLFLLGRNFQELGYKNKHTAQNQQYKCLQQLRRSASYPTTKV